MTNGNTYYSTQTQPQDSHSIMQKQSVLISALAAMVFCLLNTYYIISDIVRHFWSTPHAWPNAIALIALMVSSIAVIIVRYNKKLLNNGKVTRIALLIYYSIIVVCVTLFSYTTQVRAWENGADSEFTGITLSAYYLMLFMIAPLPNKYDSLYLVLFIVLNAFILMFAPGKEMFSAIKQFSFRAVVAVGYYYMRHANFNMINNQIRINSLNAQLAHTSFVDNLTQALNRHALDDYLHQLSKANPPHTLGVIMADIDFFKLYNDTYSHKEGDKVLKSFCDAIRATLGEKDKYLFRYGGEEFIVILQDCTDEQLVQAAQKYRKAITSLNIVRNDGAPKDHVTASFGCTQLGVVHPESSTDYITKADDQLYKAKNSGKDCIAFNGNIYY